MPNVFQNLFTCSISINTIFQVLIPLHIFYTQFFFLSRFELPRIDPSSFNSPGLILLASTPPGGRGRGRERFWKMQVQVTTSELTHQATVWGTLQTSKSLLVKLGDALRHVFPPKIWKKSGMLVKTLFFELFLIVLRVGSDRQNDRWKNYPLGMTLQLIKNFQTYNFTIIFFHSFKTVAKNQQK